MKKKGVFLFGISLFLISGLQSQAYAGDSLTTPVGSRKSSTVVLKKLSVGNPSSNRPRKPSARVVECEYDEGWLHVMFQSPEGDCLMAVTDTSVGVEEKYVFDSSVEQMIYIGDVQNAYIRISTSSGNIYGGVILF